MQTMFAIPNRKIKINGHLIEEFEAYDCFIVYVDGKRYDSVTYEDALKVCALTDEQRENEVRNDDAS